MASNSIILQLLLEIKQYQSALRQATASMQQATGQIGRNADEASRRLNKATQSTSGFSRAIDFLKKRVLGAGLFFAAFYQGLIFLRQSIGAVVGEMLSLDEGLRKIQSITLQSDASIEQLRSRLLSMAQAGKTFGQRASEIANAMFDIVQSGFSAGDALEIARVAAMGAQAGFTQADVAGRVLVAVLNALGGTAKDSQHVMDVLFETVNLGVITFNELGNSLGRALGPAAALNVPLEDLGAVIATLTRRGLTGRESITALTRIMLEFLKPSDRAKKRAQEFGFTLSGATIQSNGLVGSLLKLNEATGGNSQALAEVFSRQNAVVGSQLLLADGGKMLTEIFQQMNSASDGTGASTAAFNQRAKALNYQLKQVSVQALALTTRGLEPMRRALVTILPHVSKLLAGQGPLMDFFRSNTELVRGFAAALIFLALRAIVSTLIPALISATAALASMVETFTLWVMINPGLAAMVISIIALTTALGFLSRIVSGSDDSIARMAARMDEWHQSVQKILDIKDQFGDIFFSKEMADTSAQAISDMTTQATADMARFLSDAQNTWHSVGDVGREAGRAIQRGWRFMTSGDLRSDSKRTMDALHKNFEQIINDPNQTEKSLRALSQSLTDLQNQARDQGLYDLNNQFQQMAIHASEVADGIAKQHANQLDALEAAHLISKSTAGLVTQYDTVIQRIQTWEGALKKVKEVIKDISDLTTVEQGMVETMVADMDVKIADVKTKIADIDLQIAQRAADLGIAMSDVATSGDSVLTSLSSQKDELQKGLDLIQQQRDTTQSHLDLLQARNDADAKHIELQALMKDQADGLALMSENEKNLVEGTVAKLLEGPDAFQAWLDALDKMGIKLDDPILGVIEDIVQTMKDQHLNIDTTQAEAALKNLRGSADDTLAKIAALQSAGDLFGAQALAFTYKPPPPVYGPPAPGHAAGVRNWMGGLARVGERGMELVNLPRGSDVIANYNVPRTLRGEGGGGGVRVGDIQVNVTTSMMKDFLELKDAVLNEVSRKLDDAASRANLTKPRFGTYGAGIPRS
jgi:TP901 family phage tail tape measure protein